MNVKPVLIGMIVASSMPLLLSVFLIVVEPHIVALITIILNGFVVAASAVSIRSQKHYWLAITASLLTFLGWFWIGLAINSMGIVYLGTTVSVSIGIWAFISLRRPEVKAVFENQTDPVTPILDFITGRIPLLPLKSKLKLEPTRTNVNRVSIIALVSICLLGFILPSISELSTSSSSSEFSQEREQRQKEAVVKLEAALKSGDEKWDGDAEAAVDEYFVALDMLLNRGYDWDIPDDSRSTISRAYGRTIDSFVEAGQADAAERLILQAIEDEIVLRLKTPKGNSLLASVRAKHENQQIKERSAEIATGDASATRTQSREELIDKIHPGVPRQLVFDLLGQPDASMSLGQGQALLYYLSDTEAFFISVDKKGNVFTADKQERVK